MPFPAAQLSQVNLFPFPPNWGKAVTEILEWKTDVLRAYDGSEQRRPLRVIPRRGIEYDFMVKGDNARLFESLLWAWQDRMFAVPLWMFRGTLTAPCVGGASTIYLNTTNLGFADYGVVCLYSSPTSYELVAASIVGASQIDLQAPLTKNWPAGTRVYPALLANSATSIPTKRETDILITGRVSFLGSADYNDPFVPDVAAATVYDGKEVVTAKPNWKSGIENTWSHEFNTLDAGMGAMRWEQTEKSGRMVRPYQWLLKSKADIAAFRAFLGRMRGQTKACWIPSWHDDFTVVATTASGGSTLTLAGTEFSTLVGVDLDRDRLAIRMNDGSTLYRKIVGTTVVSGNTVLQLDTTFGTSVGPSTVRRIHLLLHCRLLVDKVEIPWRTDSVADPQLAFTTVPV